MSEAPTMRAKMKVTEVKVLEHAEVIGFQAVTGKANADGVSEDNTYAKYTPSVNASFTVTNPNLYGKFKPGQSYYVDFTEVVETA